MTRPCSCGSTRAHGCDQRNCKQKRGYGVRGMTPQNQSDRVRNTILGNTSDVSQRNSQPIPSRRKLEWRRF